MSLQAGRHEIACQTRLIAVENDRGHYHWGLTRAGYAKRGNVARGIKPTRPESRAGFGRHSRDRRQFSFVIRGSLY